MGAQIFYWTGVVIWWAICISLTLAVLFGAILAPVKVYHKVHKHLWKWKIMGEIADTGFSVEDIKFVSRVPNSSLDKVSTDDLMEWVRLVKERGDSLKLSKGGGSL